MSRPFSSSPTWTIVHSRHWKMQLPYFARHSSAITFDPRGNGQLGPARSSRGLRRARVRGRRARSPGRDRHRSGGDRRVLTGRAAGSALGRRASGARRRRASSSALRSRSAASSRCTARSSKRFDEEFDTDEGWAKFNRHYWLRDFQGFLEFFFSQCFSEPHSTKQIEDCVSWGLDTTPETLHRDRGGAGLRLGEASRASAARIRCPVLVLHGDDDADPSRLPMGVALAEHDRRPARDARGLRPRSPRPRPGEGQPAHPRLRGGGLMSLLEAQREQTRARYPDDEGYVERDGVRVFYEVYGDGEPTVFLLPTWSIIHSRHWKMQIPYFARHFRVAHVRRAREREGRPAQRDRAPTPSGSSRRTRSPSWTRPGRSSGRGRRLLLRRALGHAARRRPPGPGPGRRVHRPLRAARAGASGAERPLLRGPRSTPTTAGRSTTATTGSSTTRSSSSTSSGRCSASPIRPSRSRTASAGASRSAPETLIEAHEALELCGTERFRDVCARVRCPVLVLHGDEDALHPLARGAALAEATGGRLVTLEGSGHCPHVRDPVKVNLLIRDFVESR